YPPQLFEQPREHRSPLPRPGGDQEVVVDPLALERQRSGGHRDRLDALSLERIARGASAENQRGQEQPDLVYFFDVEEGAGEMGTALQQDRADARGAELVQRRADPRRLVLTGGHDHL